MGRALALAVLALALVVLAGCGSGPRPNEMSSDGFATAPERGEFVPADELGDLVLGEPFDPVAASELPTSEVAAATDPLKLYLTGGAALKRDPDTSRMYYPMKYGECRPIICTWNGGSVTNPPVWSITPANHWDVAECAFSAMRLPPASLGRNFLYGKHVEDSATFDQVSVSYGDQTQSIWVKVTGIWPKPGFTAPLNVSGARLKVVGNSSVWSTSTGLGYRCFSTTQTGIVTLRARIVGDYPSPPIPQWTAEQAKLKFTSPSTAWTIQFRIKQAGYWPLTAKIGAFAVTVRVGKPTT